MFVPTGIVANVSKTGLFPSVDIATRRLISSKQMVGDVINNTIKMLKEIEV